jgi:protein tyrosine/serine phosphatase
MASDSSAHSRSLLEYIVRGCVTGLLVALGLHAGYVLAGTNFRTVLPGAVYRCAQPSARALERAIRKHGIRTVVNLRGCCPTAAWYLDEARATGRLDVAQEDVGLSATRLPSVVGVRQLLDVIDHSEYPILFHCHQGADRTGLAAVMAVLLRTDASLAEARRHLGPRSGHLPFGKTGHIDRFFDLYEEWLRDEGEEHSPDRFRAWVRERYCPAEGRADIALLEPLAPPAEGRPVLPTPAGKGRLLKVRCRNTSLRAWRFQPGSNAGVHLWAYLLDRDERPIRTDRAGLFHAVVAPGEHLDLTIPLPPLPPGRYELRLDLANEQHGSFMQLGNPLLVLDVEAS